MLSFLLFILGSLITFVISQDCTPYSSSYDFSSGYPNIWEKPTSDNFNTDEFQQVYNSIDWSQVPDIQPHTVVNGDIDQSNYPDDDPDCWWTYNQCSSPNAPGVQPDVTICPEPETWGLTYDDGPNCAHNTFYDFLKENDQNATMFFIGSNVANWPKEAKRALTDGHHICCHTWSHQYMTSLTNEEVVGELYYALKAIKTVIGVTPLCWRPPYGDVDDRVRAIAQQLNLPMTVLWNLGNETSDQIDSNFQSFVDMGTDGTFANSGCIVLEHELNNGTMSKAMEWYPKIVNAYQYVVPIATCMNVTQPYAESDYSYPSFTDYTGTN
ncbi:21562_t:CDS:2 [Gigaspora rosea]|nr:21562_t:CDS:2 [Gigaspora rosea]